MSVNVKLKTSIKNGNVTQTEPQKRDNQKKIRINQRMKNSKTKNDLHSKRKKEGIHILVLDPGNNLSFHIKSTKIFFE